MDLPEPGSGDRPDLPEELVEMLRQLGGPAAVDQLRATLRGSHGVVNWDVARQLAIQLAAEGDRPPTETERQRAEQAQGIAEHWLDDGTLPSPPDAGQLAVVSRQTWANDALTGLRPFVEPVAAASTKALQDLIAEQAEDAIGLPPELALGDLGAGLAPLLRPMGAMLMGVQAGQVIGRLAGQMLGQYDLGIPTAEAATAYRIAVNVDEAFAGYDLDPTEVAVVLALHEGAHRRQYHAVPWLAGHLNGLVSRFAEGTKIDADRLMEISREVMEGVDPEDPASMQQAMERAAQMRLEPTPAQRRVLERVQGVVALLQAWARAEVRRAAQERLPNVGRIEETLRRRRAERGDGEELLAALLGLDLKPEDEEVGDRFIEAVHDARGLDGLRRALAHPENLPDTEELAEPSRWLVRMAGGEEVPDDPSALFGVGEAPVELSADERRDGHAGGAGDDGAGDSSPGDDEAGDDGGSDEPRGDAGV
jgi:putative hydrolase